MAGHHRRPILYPVNRSSVVSEAERHARPQAGRELHSPLAPAHENDVALVRRWFRHLELCVRSADYEGARPLFAQDVITFGIFAAFTSGRDATETEQWRTVWSRIDGFRWQLDDLRTILSADRRTAVGIAVFTSVGYTEDGIPYDRPGRATAVLGRDALTEARAAQHLDLPLFRDAANHSFANKAENPAQPMARLAF